MERKGSSLPSLAEATIGGEKRPHDPPERRCPSCGGVLVPEWEPFPPALTAKYDKQGVWHYPACTPKCEAEIEIREWERNRRQSKVASLPARSGIPSRLNRCTFSSFDPSFSKAAAMGLSEIRAYASSWDERRSEGRGLYLCGDTGSGKTHLAAALGRWLMEEESVPTLFVTVPELLDRMRPGGAPGEEEDRDGWASSAMNAELLVLDDVGTEKASEWSRERLFTLVNHRYREELPTLFPSNMGPRDMEAKLGGRIASRIIETCEFILLDGPDYRIESRREEVPR